MSVEDASGVTVPGVRLPPTRVEAGPRAIDWPLLVRQWAPRLVPPLAYLGLAYYFTQQFWANPQHNVFGTDDAILFSWYFQWIEHSITHLQNPFITHAMAVPGGVNVMWNTAVLVLAAVFSPLTAAIGATATVGVLESLSPALCAITAYFVLRKLTGRSLGAALGALLYGFGPFFVLHTAHLHLIFAVFPPLAVLVGHQLFVRQDKSAVRTGLLLGALIGIELLISEELVVLVALGALCALIAALIVYPREVRRRSKHAGIGLGVAAATALVITAVPLYYQFLGPYALRNGFVGARTAKTDLAGLVVPDVLQLYRSHADLVTAGRFHVVENSAYLGWPLVVFALGYAVWLIVQRDRFGLWWLLTALGVLALSLGSPIQVNGHRIWHGPWAVVRGLPLIHGVLPVRLSLIILLLIAGLIAVALASFHGWRLAIAALAVFVALIPLRPYGQYVVRVLPKTPTFFTSSAAKAIPANADVLVLPYASYPNVQSMLWQIHTGLRFNIVGGYSVFNTNGAGRYWPDYPAFSRLLATFGTARSDMTRSERAAGLASLRSTDIRYIVITNTIHRPQEVARAAAELTGCTLRPIDDVVLCAVPPNLGH